jgi:maltose alpha-D-glucosyltransferase/alpha-amylase
MIKDLWYKNAVIYCLHVGTFMDSNGDGIGDFEGLMRRLDYLAGLGVTCLWLMPFQKSPRKDDGYDISDYYEARRDPKSRYRDFYIWSDKKPKDAEQGMVFPGVQKTTWTRDKIAGAYYFHRFYDFQPDLNTRNPAVQDEIRKIMGFWLELGVDGFRMDAMPFVIQGKGIEQQHVEHYTMLREFREFLQWRRGDAIILAEANVMPKLNTSYFGEDGDRLEMMFNFWVNQRLFYALATGDNRPLVKALEQTRDRPETAQWAHFLRNHDELDLGRLTDAQRERVFEAFVPDKSMQLYDRGIRRRLAPILRGDRRRLECAYSLMFTLPGTPVIRYGDELGMGDNLELPERNCARTPMQWSTEPHAGFTRADKPILPVIDDGPYGYRQVNAADQRRDPNSLLNWTERVIRMRKEVPELGWGDFEVIDVKTAGVLVMHYTWRNNAVVTVHDLLDETVEITLPLKHKLVSLFDAAHSEPDGRGQHCVILEPYGYRWYRVGGLGYILDRTNY